MGRAAGDPEPALLGLRPQLVVRDVERTTRLLIEGLGMHLDTRTPGTSPEEKRVAISAFAGAPAVAIRPASAGESIPTGHGRARRGRQGGRARGQVPGARHASRCADEGAMVPLLRRGHRRRAPHSAAEAPSIRDCKTRADGARAAGRWKRRVERYSVRHRSAGAGSESCAASRRSRSVSCMTGIPLSAASMPSLQSSARNVRQCRSRMPSSVRRSQLVEGDEEQRVESVLFGQGAQTSQVAVGIRGWMPSPLSLPMSRQEVDLQSPLRAPIAQLAPYAAVRKIAA